MTYRITRDDPLYSELVEVVAEHPGSDVDAIVEHLDGFDHDLSRVQDELQLAVESADLIEAGEKYWVMRYDGPPE